VGERSGREHGTQLSPEELQEVLTSTLDAFNAMSPEERSTFLEGFTEPDVVQLPFVYIPPPPSDVEASAAAAPLLEKIEALLEYLGESGKSLTDRGNIKLADGKALIELLDTGDEMEKQFDDKTYRRKTTERLPGLNSIVNIAKEAGAVRVHKRRLAPVQKWAQRSATERAAALYAAIIDVGALGARDNQYEIMQAVADVLDDGTVHWLAGLLAPDAEVHVEDIVEQAEPILQEQIAPYWPQWSDMIDSLARHGICHIFETLEAAGVVEWTHRTEAVLGSDPYLTGGTIRLTSLGRHVVPDDLAEAGSVLRRVDDLAEAPSSALIEALDWVPDDQRRWLVDAWQPHIAITERVQQIVDVIASADDPALRLKGFAALELFDTQAVDPAMRRLLDGPAAGHAALYLLSRGLADETEVGELVDIGVFVDILAANLDDPEELCEMFASAPHSADQFAALEQMWRYPAAETQSVLDALGQHLPDPKLAKAARKAAVKHRSWMANRN